MSSISKQISSASKSLSKSMYKSPYESSYGSSISASLYKSLSPSKSPSPSRSPYKSPYTSPSKSPYKSLYPSPSRSPYPSKSPYPEYSKIGEPSPIPSGRPRYKSSSATKWAEGNLGFAVEVKRRGKFKRLKGPALTRKSALELGALRVEKTLARSFRIKPVSGRGISLDLPGVRYERLRKPKGKSRLPGDTFVELSKFALSTPSELMEIGAARRAKPKRAKKKRKHKRRGRR